MPGLQGQRIVLGVAGGIAAYKAADLVRRLRDAGAEVRVVMTAAAMEFVRPLTFQAVSGAPVRHDLLDPGAEAGMGHIELARWADRVLLAPATADLLARLAHGHADDLLTTVCLATEAPVVAAPAMNRVMWAHPATQANVQRLQERGVRMLGPGEGPLAERESGPGRMLEPLELVALLAGEPVAGPLHGTRVLITAGPTREPIDPVRFISNRSSGRMGFAVAAAARALGAQVALVAGPSAEATPPGVRRIDVETAGQMHQAVMREVDGCDIFVATAAVSDYRPASAAEEKIKKHDEALSLALVRNPDILAEVAARSPRPFVVGFAAETENLESHARDKLRRKGLDMIAANWVGRPGSGFDAPDNALEVYWEDGGRELPAGPKSELATRLLELVAERYAGPGQTADS